MSTKKQNLLTHRYIRGHQQSLHLKFLIFGCVIIEKGQRIRFSNVLTIDEPKYQIIGGIFQQILVRFFDCNRVIDGSLAGNEICSSCVDLGDCHVSVD